MQLFGHVVGVDGLRLAVVLVIDNLNELIHVFPGMSLNVLLRKVDVVGIDRWSKNLLRIRVGFHYIAALLLMNRAKQVELPAILVVVNVLPHLIHLVPRPNQAGLDATPYMERIHTVLEVALYAMAPARLNSHRLVFPPAQPCLLLANNAGYLVSSRVHRTTDLARLRTHSTNEVLGPDVPDLGHPVDANVVRPANLLGPCNETFQIIAEAAAKITRVYISLVD